jgi:hypothetical protein
VAVPDLLGVPTVQLQRMIEVRASIGSIDIMEETQQLRLKDVQSFTPQLTVKGCQADLKGLQRCEGVFEIHRESVLSNLRQGRPTAVNPPSNSVGVAINSSISQPHMPKSALGVDLGAETHMHQSWQWFEYPTPTLTFPYCKTTRWGSSSSTSWKFLTEAAVTRPLKLRQ